MKKYDGWKIRIGTPKDFLNQEQVTKRCLEIANAAKFPTDYKDMYEHLFENEDAELFMLIDKNEEIYGFATCDNTTSDNNTYLHGIIIHPEVQGKGFGVKLLQEIIKKDGNEFLMARTHNPRVYEMMSRVACNSTSIFPKIDKNEIPQKIWNVIRSHPATKHADKDLVVRDAYPDEKIMQEVINERIQTIFRRLNPTDAQVIVICTNPIFGDD